MRSGDVEGELVAGAGERDVEQSLFLGESGVRAQGHVGGEGAVDQAYDVDGVPFEALGGVHRGEREVVLVEVWWAG